MIIIASIVCIVVTLIVTIVIQKSIYKGVVIHITGGSGYKRGDMITFGKNGEYQNYKIHSIKREGLTDRITLRIKTYKDVNREMESSS